MTASNSTTQATKDRQQYGRVPYATVDAGVVAAMNGTDRGVYIIIMAHAGGTDWKASPGVTRIAKLAGHDRRTVQRSIGRLERLGVITVEHGGGRSKSNVYTLTTDAKQRQLDATLSSDKQRQSCAALSDAKQRQQRPERAAVETLKGGSGDPKQRQSSAARTALTTRTATTTRGEDAAPDVVVVVDRSIEEKDEEATGKENLIDRAFGRTVTSAVRPHLSGLTPDQIEAWITEANTKGTNPAAYFVKAIRGGWELQPREHRPGDQEKQTDAQRAANVSDRIRCNYTMALCEGTPEQRAAIERRFGDLDSLIDADPLDFETDRRSKIPVETLGRLVSLNGSGALTPGACTT